MSFMPFNGIAQATNDSCGAYALAAVIGSLTGAPPPGGPATFAMSLYARTGILNLNLAADEPTAQYMASPIYRNPPSMLATVARFFGIGAEGLQVVISEATQAMFSQVTMLPIGATPNNLYEQEQNIISTLGVPIEQGNFPGTWPSTSECRLVLVHLYAHWVALTSTAIYDSATGFVGPYIISPLDSGGTEISYEYTDGSGGVSMRYSGLCLRMSATPR